MTCCAPIAIVAGQPSRSVGVTTAPGSTVRPSPTPEALDARGAGCRPHSHLPDTLTPGIRHPRHPPPERRGAPACPSGPCTATAGEAGEDRHEERRAEHGDDVLRADRDRCRPAEPLGGRASSSSRATSCPATSAPRSRSSRRSRRTTAARPSRRGDDGARDDRRHELLDPARADLLHEQAHEREDHTRDRDADHRLRDLLRRLEAPRPGTTSPCSRASRPSPSPRSSCSACCSGPGRRTRGGGTRAGPPRPPATPRRTTPDR
jgi:hypothetical protein